MDISAHINVMIHPKMPTGIPGTWTLAFDDEFTGTSLDPKWAIETGWIMNNITSSASNVIMRNPGLALQVASPTSGVQLITTAYKLPVGGCCEARIWFPGRGAPTPGNSIYNWPAWWTATPNDWPAAGEIDIAEGLGTLTCNYHSPSGSHNGPQPGPVGNWSNSWNTYGALRSKTSISWFFNGTQVHSQVTDDSGAGQSLILTAGSGQGQAAYGAASLVKVAYVRAWV
jgi:beta-glucanase (GH16 family)